MSLEQLGTRALREFAAWQERNRVREALKTWMREAGYERGEQPNPDDFDDEERDELAALVQASKTTTRQLKSARASTRRYAERLMP